MNMSYCRFQNTAGDLRDCLDNLRDSGLSDDEQRARRKLITLCADILIELDAEDIYDAHQLDIICDKLDAVKEQDGADSPAECICGSDE